MRDSNRALCLAAATVVLVTASAAMPGTGHALPVAPDHACIGRWVGEGRNTGSQSSWTIDLTLSAAPSGGRCGTIEYTNPACGGTLENCNVVDGDIHTREDYSHNDGRCAPAGQVIIRCEGDRMRYSWIGWERVDSVLHRPGGSPSPSPSPPRSTGAGPGPGPGPGPSPGPGVPGQPQQGPAPRPRPSPPALPSPPAQSQSGTRGGGGCSATSRSTTASSFVPGSVGVVALALLALLALTRARRRRARRGAPSGASAAASR